MTRRARRSRASPRRRHATGRRARRSGGARTDPRRSPSGRGAGRPHCARCRRRCS
jgi:hypothetical protein